MIVSLQNVVLLNVEFIVLLIDCTVELVVRVE